MGKFPRRAATARALKLFHQAVVRCLGTAPGCTYAASFETLERRQMLSTSAVPVRHNLGKLDTNLIAAYQQLTSSKNNAALLSSDSIAAAASTPSSAAASVLHVDNGSVQLQTYANPGTIKQLEYALGKLKGQNITANGREVDVLLPFAQLGKLASLTSLRFAEATAYTVNTGSVTSQGDIAVAGPNGRSIYGVNGNGVKVGILSDSFNSNTTLTDHYSNDVATGDLPANVQILSDGTSTSTDEGRAMAQVIYDTAPGVTFDFATGGSGYGTGAKNIASLATAGAKVIVDDVTYQNEPFFADSTMAQEVSTLAGSGVTYISAAGNFGSNSYASTWRNASTYSTTAFTNASGATPFYGGTSFNFAATGTANDKQTFTLAQGASIKISLQWDQPYYSVSGGTGCRNQVDIYVLNSSNVIVGGASNLTLGADPTQLFSFTNSGAGASYKLMIVSETGYAVPGQIKYIDFSGQATNWSPANTAGTIFGHANAAGAEAVGAASYLNTPAYGVNPAVVESYSSTGGTPILFSTSGTRLTTPITRQGPAVVGPDNVFTTFYGTRTGNNAYPTFTGTSAAAAGVAGVAALLVQKNPTLSAGAIDSILNSTATAIGAAPNNVAGYGLVQAIPALAQTVGNLTGTVFGDYNASGIRDTGEPGIGAVTVYIDANNNGSLDPGETYTTTASDGSYAFYNYPSGTAVVRTVPPIGYVAVTTNKVVPIAAANTSTGVNLGLFPDAYTFSANNSNITLQLDSIRPANIDILVNNVLTYTAPISILPALSFSFSGSNGTLNINFANGNPIPTGGVTDSAIGNSTNDALIVNGTSAADTVDVNYQTTTFDGSTILLNNISSETINGGGGNDVNSVTAAQPANQSLTFNGGIGNDSLTVNDILPNNGTTTFFNAGTNNSDKNTLTVNAGTFTFKGDPAAASANLTVNLGTSVQTIVDNINNSTTVTSLFGTVVFLAGPSGSGINQRNLAGLNIGFGDTVIAAAPASHSDREVIVTGSLNFSSGGLNVSGGAVGIGTLDLNANDLIIQNGSISTIAPFLSSGYANGQWNGPGIQSSSAASDTTHLTALGSLQNGGDLHFAKFDGISSIPSAILIKYTLYGDADLSGTVDGSDYTRIDNGFLAQATGWVNGDFNYDGVVDGSDYSLIDNAFNVQGTSLG